jgi:hypothetical protein
MMRPVILDLDSSILNPPAGSLRPGARELLVALASSGAPVRLVATGAEEQQAETRKRLGAILRQEGLDQVLPGLADQLVVIGAAAGDDVTVCRDRCREGLRIAAAGSGDPGHSHTAVLLSGDPRHLEVARLMGMLAYPLSGPAAGVRQATEPAAWSLEAIAADLLEVIRFEPCAKRRATAKGRHTSTAGKRAAADRRIAAFTERVSEDRLRASLEQLVGWRTRWTLSDHIDQVVSSIGDAFVDIEYPQAAVQFQPFTIPGSAPQRNVLCGPITAASGVILVCAHYDSISSSPAVSAPGCDDNASGIAAMLEVARVLREAQLEGNVLFAAFGGEEQGLFGSRACAGIAASERWNIRLVINLDMVGYRDPARPNLITVEFDQGNRVPGNDADARRYGMVMAQAAADYTSLEVEHTDIWNSDYMPFEEKGYACIGLYDGAADAPFYHTTNDTLDKVDLAHLAEITRLLVAAIATLELPPRA